MTQHLQTPEPGLLPAFDMIPERGTPFVVGAIATGGVRTYIPVTGGRLEGEGLLARLTGGGETLLARADGVTMVEASYYLAFADGAVARCFGTGYLTSGDPVAGMRLSLLFEAAEDGSVASLATRVFLSEQLEGSAIMTISRIV